MLRGQFIGALFLTFILATGFFYVQLQAVCPLPLTFAVGSVDERFTLSEAEATAAVADAAAVWESAWPEAVFVMSDDVATADVVVQFVFDERQSRTTAEARERERLAVVEALSGEVQAAYEQLAAELGERETTYEREAAAYDNALARYNQTVAEYNAEGGAPPEVYDELRAEAERLNTEAERLSAEVAAINDLINELNQLGAEGNALVSRFNERVDDFNSTFADGREFTQGDYHDGTISIYSFADRDELHVVLVHELGHALAIEHVDEPTAYMYYLLGEQSAEQPLHAADIAAFAAVCEAESQLATIPQPWRALFAWL